MIIEIRKAGFVNKGAELMLYAILERMKKEFPNAKFCISSNLGAQRYEKLIELGFYQKIHFWRQGLNIAYFANFIPKKFRDVYGLVIDKEIDIVLDASGFSYSDQWGKESCLELSQSAKRWKRNGTKVILLPQAMGPFKSKLNIKSIKNIVNCVDLVFARELISFDHLIKTADNIENIKIAPDFTNLIDGIIPDDFNANENRFCIIPNFRMIDKTSKEVSKAYLPFLIKCVKYLMNKKQKPFILVHEGENDLRLANQISNAVDGKLNIVKEIHPLKIKGILGTCEGIIGSRFHGLVSGLSQGVPTLGTGWSHKYQMLFTDYGFDNGLLDLKSSDDEIYKKIDLIIDPKSKINIKKILECKSIELKKLSEQMWNDVMMILKDKS